MPYSVVCRAPFQILVQTWHGKTIALDVQSCDTVANVKSKIHSKEVSLPAQFQLEFRDKMLDDCRTLLEYNIQLRSLLRLCLKVRGGMADAAPREHGVTRGCRICHKTTEQTEFSNSQKKRLKKGKSATCKMCCANSAATTGSGTGSSALSDGGNAVEKSQLSKGVTGRLQKACEPIWETPGWLLSKEKVRMIKYFIRIPTDRTWGCLFCHIVWVSHLTIKLAYGCVFRRITGPHFPLITEPPTYRASFQFTERLNEQPNAPTVRLTN